MLTVIEFINTYWAFIAPVLIIVELLALGFLIRVIWQGFKEDFDL